VISIHTSRLVEVVAVKKKKKKKTISQLLENMGKTTKKAFQTTNTSTMTPKLPKNAKKTNFVEIFL
jgi:mevalonate kinase